MCCMHVVFSCFMKFSLLVLCSCCMLVEKGKKMCCIFPRVERALIFCVIYFLQVEYALVLLCYIFCVWNALWLYYAIFPRVEWSMALSCYTFPCVECALELLCYTFRMRNALWRYCVIFSACGICSGVIVLKNLRVEHPLLFCVKFVPCCNILTLWFTCVYFKLF